MRKNILNNIWYVLLKTWIYEKRVILIIVLQAIIGIVVPLAGATLPALVVNGISNDMCYSIILKIAIVLGLKFVILFWYLVKEERFKKEHIKIY